MYILAGIQSAIETEHIPGHEHAYYSIVGRKYTKRDDSAKRRVKVEHSIEYSIE